MPALTVNTRATEGAAHEVPGTPGSRVMIQNLGPGIVYLGGAAVTVSGATGGIKIDVEKAYELPSNADVPYSVTSDTDATDVRVLAVN